MQNLKKKMLFVRQFKIIYIFKCTSSKNLVTAEWSLLFNVHGKLVERRFAADTVSKKK